MSTLSTHVLDTSKGRPAEGIEVSLKILKENAWEDLASGKTNADGRIPDLLSKGTQLEIGKYKMTFETGKYLGGEGFYPFVPVVFEINKTGEHFHVPLLISPFGYSTYRGS